MKQAGLQDHVGPCGVEELEKFQLALAPDYQVKVCDMYKVLWYQGPHANDPSKVLHLLFLGHGHFDVLTSMKAVFNQSYWCEECNKAYSHRDRHQCPVSCSGCYSIEAEGGEAKPRARRQLCRLRTATATPKPRMARLME